MVRIITDSSADFEHSESEKFGISTIPLAVYIDGKEYKDDFLHSKERFYRLAKLSKTLPKTSQPSPYVYECALKKARVEMFSAKFSTALQACKSVPLNVKNHPYILFRQYIQLTEL